MCVLGWLNVFLLGDYVLCKWFVNGDGMLFMCCVMVECVELWVFWCVYVVMYFWYCEDVFI